jgi:hypothetical protein
VRTPCLKLTWSVDQNRYLCGLVLEAKSEAEQQAVLSAIKANTACAGPFRTERIAKGVALGLFEE